MALLGEQSGTGLLGNYGVSYNVGESAAPERKNQHKGRKNTGADAPRLGEGAYQPLDPEALVAMGVDWFMDVLPPPSWRKFLSPPPPPWRPPTGGPVQWLPPHEREFEIVSTGRNR